MAGRGGKIAMAAMAGVCALLAVVVVRETRVHDLAPLLFRLERRSSATMPCGYPAPVGASISDSVSAPLPAGREVPVSDAPAALRALTRAVAGDVVVFAPGTYRFSGTGIDLTHAGRAHAPIVVRAERLGTVMIAFDTVEGFHVTAPYWVFENLVVRGVCAHHDDCEHAFHIVGNAHDVVLRNNVLRDFNAPIKINGEGGRFPDDGRIEDNTLVDSAPRDTDHPVTDIDLVAADGWTIDGNFIADFVKARGDRTSYGAFAKGAGAGNRFLRNTVVCEYRLRGLPGARVGLSFGGGGTGARYCRDRRCVAEQDRGVMENNRISSCSDDGIYLNRAAHTRLAFNRVTDTAGVVARYPQTEVQALGNRIDGRLAARDGARIDLGTR